MIHTARSFPTLPFPFQPSTLSLGIMRDPVTCVGDGMTYERGAIETWLNAGNVTSPMTGLPLSNITLAPSQGFKNMILAWREGEGKALLLAQSAPDLGT